MAFACQMLDTGKTRTETVHANPDTGKNFSIVVVRGLCGDGGEGEGGDVSLEVLEALEVELNGT